MVYLGIICCVIIFVIFFFIVLRITWLGLTKRDLRKIKQVNELINIIISIIKI